MTPIDRTLIAIDFDVLPAALATAIAALLEAPDRRARGGAQRLRTFTLEHMPGQTYASYRTALDHQPAQPGP
ncbi:MAG: hypothetical protein WB580_04775 [Candidatus Binataceae bacterium]